MDVAKLDQDPDSNPEQQQQEEHGLKDLEIECSRDEEELGGLLGHGETKSSLKEKRRLDRQSRTQFWWKIVIFCSFVLVVTVFYVLLFPVGGAGDDAKDHPHYAFDDLIDEGSSDFHGEDAYDDSPSPHKSHKKTRGPRNSPMDMDMHSAGGGLFVDGSATQGSVFKASKIRSYTSSEEANAEFLEGIDKTLGTSNDKLLEIGQGELICDNWAVITTIFEPTKLVHQLEKLEDWCVVIVGDKKSPKNYPVNGARTVFLSAEDQLKLPYRILSHLQWNHFGRKNVGFVYAIHHGAKQIYDTDDDNILKYDEIPLTNGLEPEQKTYELESAGDHTVMNLYPLFNKDELSWPRGFPLHLIRSNSTVPKVTGVTELGKAQVIQSLADHDPDVDAMYRLTRTIPFDFDHINGLQRVMMPEKGNLAPFNAQATLFKQRAFWGLILPISVHGRVSDIWRSYITQRVMWDTGDRLAFTTPFVTQCRNVHNYMGDFQSENRLYLMAGEIVRIIAEWEPTSASLPGRLVELVIRLYEHDFIEKADVDLTIAWLEDLYEIGYRFPAMESASTVHNHLDDADSNHITASTCEKHAVDADACVREDVFKYFFAENALVDHMEPDPDFDFGKYKYLHIDGHKGPQVDSLATFYHEFGVPPENVATACGVNYCEILNDYKNRYSQMNIPPAIIGELHSMIVHSYKIHKGPVPIKQEVLDALEDIDVFVCSFPSWHCASLLETGKVVIVRFSHVMWHAVSDKHAVAWIETLRKMQDNPLHIVSSNNPYHYVQYKNVLGRYPLPFPATYVHMRGEFLNETYHPEARNDNTVLLIGHGYHIQGVDAHYQYLLKNRPATWNLVEFDQIITPVDKRHEVSLAIFFPYAMHTAKINELYAMGVPLLFPSKELMAKRHHAVDSTLQHRNEWPVPFHNLTKTRQGHCNGYYVIHSPDAELRSKSTLYWTQFNDYYNWPGVYYFDSWDEQDLLDIVNEIMSNPTERHNRSKQMIEFYDSFSAINDNKRGRAEFKLQLQNALQHYERNKNT